MNEQYCTSAGFLSYIAKYVCKIEPHGLIQDSDDLRNRENNASPQMRFLDARIVGAPEAVFRCFQFHMKEGCNVTSLCTKPPGARKRALARILGADAPGTDALRFFDGSLEQYARRPHGSVDGPLPAVEVMAEAMAAQREGRAVRVLPSAIDFENMLYAHFHRCYEARPPRLSSCVSELCSLPHASAPPSFPSPVPPIPSLHVSLLMPHCFSVAMAGQDVQRCGQAQPRARDILAVHSVARRG